METKSVEIKYLKKSLIIYKLYLGLFLFSISMAVFAKPILKDSNPDLFDSLVGTPILLLFILAPVGLFYSWKSYKHKEGLSITRFKYFIGHLFFCLLSFGFIIIMLNDFFNLH